MAEADTQDCLDSIHRDSPCSCHRRSIPVPSRGQQTSNQELKPACMKDKACSPLASSNGGPQALTDEIKVPATDPAFISALWRAVNPDLFNCVAMEDPMQLLLCTPSDVATRNAFNSYGIPMQPDLSIDSTSPPTTLALQDYQSAFPDMEWVDPAKASAISSALQDLNATPTTQKYLLFDHIFRSSLSGTVRVHEPEIKPIGIYGDVTLGKYLSALPSMVFPARANLLTDRIQSMPLGASGRGGSGELQVYTDIHPQCVYYIRAELLGQLPTQRLPAYRITHFLPYFTIEIDWETHDHAKPFPKMALFAATAIYNRWFLSKEAKCKQMDQVQHDQVRHWSMVVTRGQWTLYCAKPKGAVRWEGCKIVSVATGGMSTAGVASMIDCVNGVHHWAVQEYVQACQQDLRNWQ